VTPASAVRRVVAQDSPTYRALISRLGIDIDTAPDDDVFVLAECDGRLDLRPPGESGRPGIHALFPTDHGREVGPRNPLVRAFGPRIGPIFDLTAGLGGDAYRLADAGHSVIAFERDPAVYAVLITGWMSDCASGRVSAEIANRLRFEHVESAKVFNQIDAPNSGVYLDPMYPQPRRSKSLPRRELQVLRQLLGEESDAAELIEACRRKAARVVVKRPHRAEPLVPGASFEIATKLVRFDVYVNPERMRESSS
jgi:hypothetical protein